MLLPKPVLNKLVFTLFFLFLSLSNLQAQNSYIQVNGEAGLSVFLNGLFKGKTSADIGGYVIENVSPGQNKLKIVKDGYAPYEEVVTVKAGEVLAYKVKPFSKHTVLFSEQGNSQSTNEQVKIETGKLIIQSVPIEIKLSISNIENADNLSKTKDQWLAESVPAGNYTIEFSLNDKKIKKIVEILANETTSVFANMLSSEITVKNSIEERKVREELDARKVLVFDSLATLCKFNFRTESDFRNQNPGITKKMNITTTENGATVYLRNPQSFKYEGPFSLAIIKGSLAYSHLLHIKNGDIEKTRTYFNELKDWMLSIVSKEDVKESNGTYFINFQKSSVSIQNGDIFGKGYIIVSFSTTTN
ncbi:PEGA domain-containing protein [Solitalea lacus]|uniref:PEGA domain-containing protein n=1 Tax=Solitalea lacus TaxID=2911172 RepID=UPI001EDAF5EA|nr:PEGA domain-containing protein [Solitalea lacus]UKJ06308.1 PEGA domain-containing protein [Solitalea lacus]